MLAPSRPLTVFAELDSTQKQAQRLRDSQTWTDNGVLFHVCADYQHAGQGRFARTWEAPKGTCSLTSTVIRLPRTAGDHAPWLTALAALAIRDAIIDAVPALTTELRISWPNDLLLAGKKVAGVLATVLPDSPAVPSDVVDIVVGAGINVDIPADHLPTPRATSLRAYGIERVPAVASIRSAYAGRVERRFADFAARDFDPRHLHAEFSTLLDGVGAHVTATHMGARSTQQVSGTFVGVHLDGSALVDTPTGTRSFSSADMSFSTED